MNSKSAYDRIRESYDVVRSDHLYQMQRSLNGFEPGGEKYSNTGGRWFRHYRPLLPDKKAYNKSRPILNNLRILLAQTRASEIVPKWRGAPSEAVEVAREAWWRQRSQGLDGYGGWKDDIDGAFTDFAALGEGFVRIGVREYEDGNRVGLRYVSPLHVVVDPLAASPQESDFIAFVTLYGVNEAMELFGDNAKDHVTGAMDQRGYVASGVYVVEYYSRGNENKYIAMTEGGEILKEADNPFNTLPVMMFRNYKPPGFAYPIGSVEAQTFAAAQMNDIDELIRRQAFWSSLLAMRPDLVHKDDIEKLSNNEEPRFLRLNIDKASEGQPPFYEIPRTAVNSDIYALRSTREQELRDHSGITQMDLGGMENSTTATQANITNQRSSAQSSFMSREFARGYQSGAVTVGTIAKDHDTAPFLFEFNGIPVTANGPDKLLSAANMFSGPLSATVGEEELTMTDATNRRNQEYAKWMDIYAKSMNPKAFEEALKAQGIKNPADFMPLPPTGMQNDVPLV